MRNSDFYVIAHNIRSLYNVGSIFRTSDALGVKKLFLTGYTGTPKNPRLHKTALGAEISVPWEYHKRLSPILKKLREEKIRIVGLENNVPKTIFLHKFHPKYPLALLLGKEVKGIPKKYLEFCDTTVEIPQAGEKESLNVAVAFGIAAFSIKYL